MPVKRFDDRNVRSLPCPPGADRAEYSDDLVPGLRLRVTSTGSRSWSVVYRIKGRESEGQKRKTIGPLSRVGLAQAREEARATLNLAHAGADPSAAPSAEVTFEELFARYLEREAKKKIASWKDTERKIGKDVLPYWKGRAARSIRRADVLEVLDRVSERAPITANRLLAMISATFRWGILRDLVEVNPAYGIPLLNEETERSRVVSDAELRDFVELVEGEINGAGRVPDDPRHGLALLLRCFTMQRSAEVVRMKAEDVDGDWWNLPAATTKTKRAHRVFLIPLAQERVLSRLEPDRNGHIFGSRRRLGNHFTPYLLTRFMTCAQKVLGVDWTARDLRRTGVTVLARLGVRRDIRMRIVNHSLGGSVHDAHYDRYDYDTEKRAAMMLWEGHLRSLLEGSGAARILPLVRG